MHRFPKYSGLLMFSFFLTSCGLFNFITQGPEVKTEKFRYYNNHFILGDAVALRTDGMYKKTSKKQDLVFTDYFQFFNNGLVKYYHNTTNGDVIEMEDTFVTTSSYYGYYALKGDSILFTMKPFYSRKEEVEGKGKLDADGMGFMLQLYRKGKASELKRLVFEKMGN